MGQNNNNVHIGFSAYILFCDTGLMRSWRKLVYHWLCDAELPQERHILLVHTEGGCIFINRHLSFDSCDNASKDNISGIINGNYLHCLYAIWRLQLFDASIHVIVDAAWS